MSLKVEWHDSGREPQCPPNPSYPDGKDLDARTGSGPFCEVDLPYPAKRCGHFTIECPVCGMRVGATTAGRPDDPRSIKISCQIEGSA